MRLGQGIHPRKHCSVQQVESKSFLSSFETTKTSLKLWRYSPLKLDYLPVFYILLFRVTKMQLVPDILVVIFYICSVTCLVTYNRNCRQDLNSHGKYSSRPVNTVRSTQFSMLQYQCSSPLWWKNDLSTCPEGSDPVAQLSFLRATWGSALKGGVLLCTSPSLLYQALTPVVRKATLSMCRI